MNAVGIVALACTRIAAAPARAVLTMLGVVVGVAALVALTSVATGATSTIAASLGGLGATTVTVQSGGTGALDDADVAAVGRLSDVAAVAATASGTGVAAFGGRTARIVLNGVSDGYRRTVRPAVAVGRFLPVFPGSDATRAVVLSAAAATGLHVTATDMGRSVTLDGVPFTLVGVLDDADGFGATGSASVSLAAARQLFAPTPAVDTITVRAATAAAVPQVQRAVNGLLRVRYGLAAGDTARFSTTNLASVLATIGSIKSDLSLLLGGIASISLVVGGIGILNIMLVSVRERTREIGIRRAIGARRRQILAQFLAEAVLLSALGGILGCAAGVAAAVGIADLAGWPAAVEPGTLGLALGFSIAVGAVFGVWPAWVASRLQPVEALRFE